MRVLLLTGLYPSSKMPLNGLVVAAQRDSLQALGVDVDLVHLRPNGRPDLSQAFLELRRAVRNNGYDLVHAHYGLSATLLGLFQDLPLVVTFHGTDINGYPLTSLSQAPRAMAINLLAMTIRYLARHTDAIIVMTPDMKNRLSPSAQLKTWIRPNGIDTKLFYPLPYEKARQLLGWGPEPFVLFCDNNREQVKRRDLAEKAVSVSRTFLPDVKLLTLRGLAYEKMHLVLSAADCLLVTSDREGSPNIVRESLACNLPIVSVPVGDIPELLSKDSSAGHITPRDPIALGNAIVDIVKKPRPKHLSQLIEDSSLEAVAKEVTKIYDFVLTNSSKRSCPQIPRVN